MPLHGLHTGAESASKGGENGRSAGILDVGAEESTKTEAGRDPLLVFLLVSTATGIMAHFHHIVGGVFSVYKTMLRRLEKESLLKVPLWHSAYFRKPVKCRVPENRYSTFYRPRVVARTYSWWGMVYPQQVSFEWR